MRSTHPVNNNQSTGAAYVSEHTTDITSSEDLGYRVMHKRQDYKHTTHEIEGTKIPFADMLGMYVVVVLSSIVLMRIYIMHSWAHQASLICGFYARVIEKRVGINRIVR